MRRLCSSGSSPSADWFEAHPGANTFPPVCALLVLTVSRFTRAHPASRNTFSVSTITDGNARAGGRSTFPPLRRPDCTLSRLRAEEYDRPVTQSIATPEPSSRTIPTLDRTLLARWSLECVTTLLEPTVLSRLSCLPFHLNFDIKLFSPALPVT